MKMENDNYNYVSREATLVAKLNDRASNGCKNAKDIVQFLDYIKYYESNISKAQRVKLISRLSYINKDYLDKHTKSLREEVTANNEDYIIELVYELNNSKLKSTGKPRSPATIRTDKVCLRKFIGYLIYGNKLKTELQTNGHPRIVKLINTNLTKLQRKQLQKSEEDILTHTEMKQLIDGASYLRDKAIISFMYETGCRVGELLNLRLMDLKFIDRHKIKVSLFGKTGDRDVVIVRYSKYFIPYLNTLKDKKKTDKVFWQLDNKTPLTYVGNNQMLKRLAVKVGIEKRIHNHIIRHTSITHKLQEGWTETNVKLWHWGSVHSNELKTYAHLTSNDAIDYAIGLYSPQEKKKLEIEFISCNSCGATCETNELSCWFCKINLNKAFENSLVEMDKQEKLEQDLLAMYKLYVSAKTNMNVNDINTYTGTPDVLKGILNSL